MFSLLSTCVTSSFLVLTDQRHFFCVDSRRKEKIDSALSSLGVTSTAIVQQSNGLGGEVAAAIKQQEFLRALNYKMGTSAYLVNIGVTIAGVTAPCTIM